jgi:hypothetical protein
MNGINGFLYGGNSEFFCNDLKEIKWAREKVE